MTNQTLVSKTVVELRAMAKAEGLNGYSKMNKLDLVDFMMNYYRAVEAEEAMVSQMSAEEFIAYESEETYVDLGTDIIAVESVAVERVLDKSGVSDFVNRYKGFTLYEHLRNNAPYARQINLAKAIMNNFEAEIAIDEMHNAGQLSDVLSDMLTSIENGTLKARPKTEVEALVKAYKPSIVEMPKTVNTASKAQIAYINRLEKETGVVNKRIVDSVKTANEIIKEYLKIKETQSAVQHYEEVAVTTVKDEPVSTIAAKLADTSFRTKFASMIKRIFA